MVFTFFFHHIVIDSVVDLDGLIDILVQSLFVTINANEIIFDLALQATVVLILKGNLVPSNFERVVSES